MSAPSASAAQGTVPPSGSGTAAAPATPPAASTMSGLSASSPVSSRGPGLSRPCPVLPTGPSSIPPVQPLSPSPYSGPQRHCSFVLLAEFDILKGSQLRYQYPRPTKIKENLIAESMLPEGAHLRESDWTITTFTNERMIAADAERRAERKKAREKAAKELAKNAAEGNKSPAAAAASAAATAGAADSTSPVASVPSPALSPAIPGDELWVEEVELSDTGYLCVLNLVRTKMDRTVARGAIVKALAIATRHRFYNIFKPLLMLSLDQLFDSPLEADRQQILVNLYHTVNNMPLGNMPELSPLQQRLSRATRLRTATNPSASDYFAFSVRWDSAPSATAAANAAAISTGGAPSPGGAALPMRVPLAMEVDEVLEASLTTLVNRFQKGVMDIYTALLAEKRVIFLGYQQPASVCSECVLSACLLISPPLVGTIRRAFPYANLVDMSFLAVPGFVAGCTNPIFEGRNQWWDLLCNITDGSVTFSQAYAEEIASQGHHEARAGAKEHGGTPTSSAHGGGAGVDGNTGAGAGGIGSSTTSPTSTLSLPSSSPTSSSPTSPSSSLDERHCQALVDSAFFSSLLEGIQLKMGEEWVRCQFRDLTAHILALAGGEEPFLFDDGQGGQKAFHLAAQAFRLRAFAKSKQCAEWRAAQREFVKSHSAFGPADPVIRQHVRTLQLLANARSSGGSSRKVGLDMLLPLYSDLAAVAVGREALLELLAAFPESQGGLFPLAVGLLHSNSTIRDLTVDLLQRLDALPEGSKAVSTLDYFTLLTFYRYSRQAPAALGDEDSDGGDLREEEGDTLGPPSFASPSTSLIGGGSNLPAGAGGDASFSSPLQSSGKRPPYTSPSSSSLPPIPIAAATPLHTRGSSAPGPDGTMRKLAFGYDESGHSTLSPVASVRLSGSPGVLSPDPGGAMWAPNRGLSSATSSPLNGNNTSSSQNSPQAGLQLDEAQFDTAVRIRAPTFHAEDEANLSPR